MRQEWLRQLVDTSPDMIVAVDHRGQIAWANQRASELTGYPAADLVGRSVDELVPAELGEQHRTARTSFAAHPRPRHMGESRVLRMRRADGIERFVEVSLTPLADAEAPLVFATVRDVTERVDAQRRHDATLRELIARTPTLVMVVRDGHVIFANARLASLVGRTVDALLERPLEALFGSAIIVPTVLDATRTALEVSLVCADESVVRVELEPPVPVELEGQPAQLLVAVDRTELLRLRTGALAAERLIAEGVLAAGVAHELATPLQSLVSVLDLARHARTDELDELLASAREALRHMTGVVDDLRGAGRTGTSLSREVDLRHAVEAALRLASAPLKHAAAQVAVQVPSVVVRADRTRLTQVLANLLVNAAHAVRERGAERSIVVSAEVGEWADVAVTDTGVGIAASVLPNVFEPYFTTRGTNGGTGLGLSICRTLVRAMGGDIAIESAPGAGTTVRVRLARAR